MSTTKIYISDTCKNCIVIQYYDLSAICNSVKMYKMKYFFFQGKFLIHNNKNNVSE